VATGPDTLWERFLKPVARVAIDGEALQRQYEGWDWSAARARFENPQVRYPEYYTQNFHGIEQGYLTSDAAITYDPVTQYALPPNETWVREDAVKAVRGTPRAILDLGCGTGSTTVLLQQAFPDATVVGLDLSPYMLAVAADKARRAGLPMVQWRHGLAEATGLNANSFDLVTASLLFHETPPTVTQAILRESCRLLRTPGQFLALDGNQQTLRSVPWLMEIFEEPYIQDYANGNLERWLGAAGFDRLETQSIWGLHQVSSGWKPQPVGARTPVATDDATEPDSPPSPIPA